MVVRIDPRPGEGGAGRSGFGRGLRLAPIAKWLALIGLALTAANCAGPQYAAGRHPSELKYGVRSSPRVIPEGQPIPKGGGRDMVGQPYTVGGRTYVPHEGRGYAREGLASWYGSAFHGRLTANGEVFDRQSVAAAHPTLPLPCYVRVTNLANGRSLIVRVNDRGPYEKGRLIDLSERAAQALEFHRRGTTRVRVEYAGKASLAGSDDERLMATLRTGDEPDGRGAFRVARFDDRPAESPRAAKALAEEVRPSSPAGASRPPRRSLASAAEPNEPSPRPGAELGPLY